MDGENDRTLLAVILGLALVCWALTAEDDCTGEDCQQQSLDVKRECPYPLVGIADLPEQWRERNYAGGSCGHAAMISALRWQGLYELADWWRSNHAGGVTDTSMINAAEQAGLRFAYTDQAESKFLEWCGRTRRAAVIFYFPAHAINFLGYHDGKAVLLDNNRTDRYLYVPRAEFLSKWAGWGGFALAPVYDPRSPKPW